MAAPMGLFNFLKSLLFGSDDFAKPPVSRDDSAGPRDRRVTPGGDPSSLENRDLSWQFQETPPPPVDPNANFSLDTHAGDGTVVHRPGDTPPILEGTARVAPPQMPSPHRTGQQPSGQPGQASRQSGGAQFDTAKFQPLTTSEALDATDSENWRNAYLDPLNVIPPEDLPRIQVIDRTMVGYGLITAEELAEIHEIGRRMDVYRNEAAVIQTAGRQAVERDRAQRERIKAEKQREAAARKEARAQTIAQRRATDIIFLGRGISKNLADRRANIEKLNANKLPVLSTPAELAETIGLTIPRLRWLAFHSEAPTRIHYVLFHIKKRSGGLRQLAAPHRDIARAQNWIKQTILDPLPLHDAAHGFVPGRSTVTNAEPHVGSDVVVNTDLQDFFPSIIFYRVEGLFRSFGFSPAVATILALLTTECPREQVRMGGETYYPATGPRALPQGACTSPAISNLISRRLDQRLQGVANSLGMRYTRYADDLTFSTSGEAANKVAYLLACIRHIADEEGFRVHPKKTRVCRQNARQSVTGVVVNQTLGAPRPLVRRLRAILHNAKQTGLDAQNRENHPHFESWVRGMIAYIEMLNPAQGGRLRAAYEALL